MRRSRSILGLMCLGMFLLGSSVVHGQSGRAIVAWGHNYDGQCDIPEPNNNFLEVAGGSDHSLGLKSDGTIAAWGSNTSGQCDVPEPNSGFLAVAGGYSHSLGLKSDGTIVAWGSNDLGQCNVPEPNNNFLAIAGGEYHNLGLKSDGTIVAWGYNRDGQCDVPEPNSDFMAVAGGCSEHSLGLKSDGTIVAWGSNDSGQCDIPEPNGDFLAIAGGEYHSLGLKSDGTIVAWGHNVYDQCDVPAPNNDFLAVAGGEYHSLGLKSDGTIVAWGHNVYDQCDVPAPNNDFLAIAGGEYHSLGIIKNQPSTTMMIFLNGDNNLDPYSVDDFNEMESAASRWVNIVVCWDRLGPDNSAYYLVRPDDDPGNLATYTEGVDMWAQGELNMGDPATLTAFTGWATTNFPAPIHGLVVWNHGGGWGPRKSRGISWDDTDGSDFFTTAELQGIVHTVHTQIGQEISLLGLDACLMEMIEIAYAVREDCLYMVGSEEWEPGDGWSYDAFLPTISANSVPSQICSSIVQSYNGPTQSAFACGDLMTDIAQSVDELAAELIASLPLDGANIIAARARPDLVTFDYNGGGNANSDSYVDLLHLCQILQEECTSLDLLVAAQWVIDDLVAARVDVKNEGPYYAPAGGLSIYFPDHQPDMVHGEDYFANYTNQGTNPANLTFVADTRWVDFLNAFLNLYVPAGEIYLSASATEQVRSIDGVMPFEPFNFFVVADVFPWIAGWEASVEFADPNALVVIARNLRPGSLNIGVDDNFLVGFPDCPLTPLVVVEYSVMFLVPVTDYLISLGPAEPSSFPLSPEPAWADCRAYLRPFEESWSTNKLLINPTLAGMQETPTIPNAYALQPAFPNPFNPKTTIRYDMPEPGRVSLRVFDMSGRLVKTIINEDLVEAGRHEAVWIGRDESGRAVAAGIYFYRLETAGFTKTKRMTLLK